MGCIPRAEEEAKLREYEDFEKLADKISARKNYRDLQKISRSEHSSVGPKDNSLKAKVIELIRPYQ